MPDLDLDPDTDLSFTRTLAAPRRLIWECWTDPRHIPQFFVPAPHRVTAVDIDLRVGGRFNTTFDVDGNVMDNKGVYLEVVPTEKLVFTDAYTEGWKPASDPFMTAILLLEDAPGGSTAYTAIARHRNRETRKAHADMGFFDGWGTVATQLETYARSLMG
ncbi:MAG: polyketide cyclase [Alphaproteobacteria bacterium HGW-Alphaproteobacteria-2]|nr:MAG: polyketide cyclase [Alphaproteobacteria bacterium HGW-Alphaproteobacteria-2]